MRSAEYFGRIGLLLNEIGPKSERFEKGMVYIEGGPMPWNDGTTRGQVFGPYNNADEAHNYIAVKIERHRLTNAKYHGETGRPPHNDREYMGHPYFQYRIMPGEEYMARYFAEVNRLALAAMVELLTDDEPEIFWPANDGIDEPILDDDETTEDPNEL